MSAVTAYSQLFSAGSIFRGDWLDCPSEWHQPELASEMETLRSVRDLTNKVLETARTHKEVRSSAEAEVSIVTTSERLSDLLQSNLNPNSELESESKAMSVEFDLSDLLIVSDVKLVSVDHGGVAFIETGEILCGEDEVCEVTVSAWPARFSGKHKCPRCWKHSSTTPGDVCRRCAAVEYAL